MQILDHINGYIPNHPEEAGAYSKSVTGKTGKGGLGHIFCYIVGKGKSTRLRDHLQHGMTHYSENKSNI